MQTVFSRFLESKIWTFSLHLSLSCLVLSWFCGSTAPCWWILSQKIVFWESQNSTLNSACNRFMNRGELDLPKKIFENGFRFDRLVPAYLYRHHGHHFLVTCGAFHQTSSLESRALIGPFRTLLFFLFLPQSLRRQKTCFPNKNTLTININNAFFLFLSQKKAQGFKHDLSTGI